MNKRLISLLLVVMMICSLLPMTVFATDTDTGANDPEVVQESDDSVDVFATFMDAIQDLLFTYDEDRQTTDEVLKGVNKEKNIGAVAVPIFGKELSDIVREGNLFQYTKEALQVRLSGKSVIPVTEVTLIGDPDDENTKDIKQTLKEADYSAFHGLSYRFDATVTGKQFIADLINDTYKMGSSRNFGG